MESHIPHVDIKITFLLCCYYIIFPLFMLCGQPLWYIASKPAIHKIIIFVFFPENCVGQTSWHKRFRKLFPTCLEKFLAQPTSTAIFLLNCRDVSRFEFQVVLLIIIFHSQDLLSRNVLSNVPALKAVSSHTVIDRLLVRIEIVAILVHYQPSCNTSHTMKVHYETQWPTAARQCHFVLQDVSCRQSWHLYNLASHFLRLQDPQQTPALPCIC